MTAHPRRGGPRAWAELTRISNAPTVLTNVLVGVSVLPVWRTDLPHPASDARICDLSMNQWMLAALLMLAMLLLYVAGMALNDWADRKHDRRAARHRPIPSGRITPNAALAFTIIAMLAAAALMTIFGTQALLATAILIALITAYDLLHKRVPMTVLLMGGCRAMVYIASAIAVGGIEPRTWWPAVLVLLYTTLLTLIARGERGPGRRSRFLWFSWFLPLLIAAGFAFRSPSAHLPWTIIVGLLMATWLWRSALLASLPRPRTIRAVLGWLSGFCLIDAFFLALLDQPCLALLAIGAWITTALGHTRISGT